MSFISIFKEAVWTRGPILAGATLPAVALYLWILLGGGCQSLTLSPGEDSSQLVDAVHKFADTNLVTGLGSFITYTGTTPAFSVEIPKNWVELPRLNLGDDGIYSNGTRTKFRGPAESGSKMGYTALTLLIIPVSSGGALTDTLPKYITQVTAARSVPTPESTAETSVNVAGETGTEVSIVYNSNRHPFDPSKDQSVKTKMTWSVVRRGDFYWDLRYTASTADYDTYLEAYTRAKQTFQFQ